jgi:hypothetical protein
MRWQYRIVGIGMFKAGDAIGMSLSYFGQHGWELVGIYDKASNWIANIENGFMLFKRPVAPGAEPEGAWSELWSMDHVAQAMASMPRVTPR